MSISAAMVKELRERTGAGMMDCKKALTETGGDVDAAVDLMRKSGAAKADKRAGRVAAEGLVIVQRDNDRAAIVEVNCETDFVARGDAFRGFAQSVAAAALASAPADLEALNATALDGGKSVDETRRDLVAEIGENVQVRRFGLLESTAVLATYVHSNEKIGVLIAIEGGDDDLARDVAMHVAWSNPVCLRPEDVPADQVAHEKEILVEQARGEGKPENIIEKMVAGRLQKFLNEKSLLGQAFVKDPKTSVGKLLGAAEAVVSGYLRFEVGEGIEKKNEDFAAEVMAQVRGEG